MIHGFEEKLGGLFGATGAGNIRMPFMDRSKFNCITTVERKNYEQAVEDWNIGKPETETLGYTSIVGLTIAEEMINKGRARFPLVIGYDNLGRYNTVVENPNSIYQGNWRWS
ncbi:MAG: hypothetical protein PHZ00_07450 [Candidatus Peribacteraceae bacterium]|nr:hypothetical protein [Candidatus Peribacteraceae bacterium]